MQLVAGVMGAAPLGTALAAAMPAPAAATTAPEDGDEGGVRGSHAGTSAAYSPLTAAAALFGLALLILFAGQLVEMTGGAALGVVVLGTSAAQRWGPAGALAVGSYFGRLWNSVGPGRYCSPCRRIPFNPGNEGLK